MDQYLIKNLDFFFSEDKYNGSRSLVLLNWQDSLFQLECPMMDVVEWKFHFKNGSELDEFKEDFENSNDHVLSYTAKGRFEYLRSYSCRSSSGCWHHFNLVTKSLPKTKFPIQAYVNDDVSFYCYVHLGKNSDHPEVEEEEENSEEVTIQNGPFKIKWKLPNSVDSDEFLPDNVKIVRLFSF